MPTENHFTKKYIFHVPDSQPSQYGSELEYLRFAIDQAASVSISDLEGNILFVNDKFLETARYTREDVLGKNHRLLNSGHHSREFFQELWDTINAGRIWKGDVRNRAKDGALFWMDTTIVPLLGPDRRPCQFIAIRHDITKQKVAESRLEEERARHLYAERLAALGEMQAEISHEIKNPLSAIRLQAEILKKYAENGTGSPEGLANAAKRIEQLSDRIVKIICGMQTFSRNAESDPFELASAEQIVKDATEFCQAHLKEKKIGISSTFASPRAEIFCRPAQISQVLLNLINNARDAIENLSARWIKIHVESTPNSVLILITDSGSGISSSVQARLMEPFFSTKPPGKGSGLGLNISRKIMECHGGSLKLNPLIQNTCFILEFPNPANFSQ